MTYQEALQKERRWDKRAILISLYHGRMLLKNTKWNQRRTARKLGISLGAISEAIKLAKALTEEPELKNLKREEALAKIKNGE